MRGYESKVLRSTMVLLACAALWGCGGPLRYTPQGTARAPGADALIVADVNADTAITRLNIKVENLPPPDRLESGGAEFVVWARGKDKPWQRVGALKYDSDARKGELAEASVPLVEFELLITAEKKSDPESPSKVVVISQEVED
jgi:predicted small lipoprotein YifL